MSTVTPPESKLSTPRSAIKPSLAASSEAATISSETPRRPAAAIVKPKIGSRQSSALRYVYASLAGFAIVATVVGYRASRGGQPTQDLIFHTVKISNLPITVVERGNLESQQNLKVISEVDDIRGDGIDGHPIIDIVPNGTEVKQGDLLVEFDSASHQERLDEQILETETAVAEQIQADVAYKNQKSQNETALQQAKLAVNLAQLQLEMFEDKKKGTHKLEADEIQRQIDDTENEILSAKASLKLAENERNGVESLFRLGYAGKSELDRTQLDYLQAQSQLAAKINRLETHVATLEKKTDYERRMSLMEYEGQLQTAKRDLEQVVLNNQALLAQAKAKLDRANRALEKEKEVLDRYRDQLKATKIYAPQDGMVAYAMPSRYSRTQAIAKGALVRERQHILSLPNLSMMQVKTSVHESVQNQIQAGLPATVRIDAFSDRTYRGTVQSVAVLPDQGSWYNSDTKMYETFVTIDETVEDLKPGMTAVVEIHVDTIEDVLTVPVQAVVQEQESTYVYVQRNGIERQEIEVGATNEKVVEVKHGLAVDDRVVLNPMGVKE